jgi:hypothetical protein
MLKFRALIILTLASILSSCGGGSDSSTTVNPPPPNQAPVAAAGADQSVNEGATVELSGSGTDSDGNIVSYSWLQEAGTVVAITNADQANASFVAPMVSASEILLFRLTVTDDDGADGSDTVSVTVNNVPIPPPPPPNQAPTANAGVDQTVDEGATVSLSGTGTDSDGNIEAYNWQQISGLGVMITNAGMANASFTAPNVEATKDLLFRLTVTDDDGATGSDTVTITVNDTAPSNNAPSVTFDQPEDGAAFGSNETIALAATATDPEDGVISNNIIWTSDLDGNLGTGATLSTTLSVGVHILTASITDSGGSSASDSVTITVGSAFAATFTFPGGSIFGHQPVPQVDGFDYYFTPLSLDASIVGEAVAIESVEVSAFGQNSGDVINFDWEVHIGPAPFGLPEGQFVQTLIDPVTGYNRIAPTQFRFTIGSQLDDQSYLFSGLHDFTTGSTSANPYFSVVHAAFTSPVTLADGLYAQIFLWTADNRNSSISFDEITLTVRGTGNDVPTPPGSIIRTGVAVSAGPITGFGSIIVNGIAYDTSSATFTRDDNPSLENEFKVGETVIVKGTIDDDNTNAVAETVDLDEIVKGPATQAAATTATVLGQTVTSGGGPLVDDSCTGVSFDDLSGLSGFFAAEVYGTVKPDGSVDATFIECKTEAEFAGDEFEVNGIATSVTATTFMVNGLEVDYSATPLIQNFPSGQISENDPVEVKGAPTAFNSAQNTLAASKVEYKGNRLDGNEGDHFEVEGFISVFRGVDDFDLRVGLDTFSVITDPNSTVFEGDPNLLDVNVKVEVEGEIDGDGNLFATKVEIKP